MKRTIFQTLEDRNNIDFVKSHGPFVCSRKDAFLGEGYYFWDSNINHAHAWGKSCYRRYYIGKIDIPYDPSRVFDLLDPKDLQELREAEESLQEKNKTNRRLSVRVILDWLRKVDAFRDQYVAIRAKDSKNPTEDNRIYFSNKRREYLDLSPRVQICYFSNISFRSLPFTIVYPERYLDISSFAV